ncbi:MAG: T9SS type A sorting domain-containing protein [Chitinophagales bacterium]|nr:T9SS type A sorting domain-containing protein [Chitinophagales bacterium]
MIHGSICHAQIISTVAGTGIGGYNGDGIAAVTAKLYYPAGVALDAAGNIYVADMSNACVRKINAVTGIISTVAGKPGIAPGFFAGSGTPATSATFSWYVLGVVPDAAGNIYIADAGSNIICKVAAGTGIITIFAGINGSAGTTGDGGSAASARLNYPAAMAFDVTESNLYIADCYNHKIRKIAINTGIISTVAGTGTAGATGDGGPATAAKLNYPAGIAVDAAGNIYVGDGGNNKVRKITLSTGIISTIAGTGTAGFSGDLGVATAAKFNGPQGLAVDESGNVYIADQGNNRIRKITAGTNIISTIAGSTAGFSGDGGLPELAKLNAPWSLALLANCTLIIADNVNNRIRKITGLTACTSLPVEVIDFIATNHGHQNLLQWTTASELNNDYFTVERSSDAKTFESIAFIDGAGNATHQNSYAYTDEDPYDNISYYRLRQTDFNGSFSYSKTISVIKITPDSCFNISPNPFHFSTTISYAIPEAAIVQIDIFDAAGHLVQRVVDENCSAGVHNTTLNCNHISPGVYLLKFHANDEILIRKVVLLQ